MIYIAEIVFSILAVVFLVSQVLIPTVLGRKMFPMFRGPGEIEKKIVDVHEQLYEKCLEEELEEEKKKLNQ